MAKVFIGVGHGGSDPGAVKHLKEADVNLIMALACADVLEAHGVAVKLSRYKDENDDINEEIRECNAYSPDLAIDVHNNAGGGDGFEVYHSINGGTGKTLATNIEAEIKKIGQNSRGVKTRKNSKGTDYYGFIRSTKCPAVICEGVFVDNATDVKIADTVAEQKEFGKAYARGILKTLGIEYKSTAEVNSPVEKFEPYLVKVTIPNLNIRMGAGTNYGILGKCPKGVYTIIEVKAGWGKLKSSTDKVEKWISLNYATKL